MTQNVNPFLTLPVFGCFVTLRYVHVVCFPGQSACLQCWQWLRAAPVYCATILTHMLVALLLLADPTYAVPALGKLLPIIGKWLNKHS
jgi:hypothetical protein